MCFFFFKLSSLIAATKKQEKASALSLAEDGKELPHDVREVDVGTYPTFSSSSG